MKNSICILGGSSFLAKEFISTFNTFKIKVVSRKRIDFYDSFNHVEMFVADTGLHGSLQNILEKNDIVINLIYDKNNFEQNIKIIENILECSNKIGISKLIHLSTAAVVGEVNHCLINEDTLCNPVTDYEKNKLILENIINSHSGGFEKIILRPTAIFGEGGRNLEKMINEILYSHSIKNLLKLFVSGNRSMNLISSKHVIKGINFIIENQTYIEKETYILSHDYDANNFYKFVFDEVASAIDCRSLFLSVPFSLSKRALYITYKLLQKNAPSTSYKFSSAKINDIGFKYNSDFLEDIREFASAINKKSNAKI